MQPTRPIGGGLAFVLIVFGIIVDFIQFVLAIMLVGEVVDSFIDVIAGGVVTLLLYNHDPRLLQKRRLSVMLTGFAELIPFLNALPWWTIDMIYIVWSDRRMHERLKPEESASLRSGGTSIRL